MQRHAAIQPTAVHAACCLHLPLLLQLLLCSALAVVCDNQWLRTLLARRRVLTRHGQAVRRSHLAFVRCASIAVSLLLCPDIVTIYIPTHAPTTCWPPAVATR